MSETHLYPPPDNVVKNAYVSGMDAYRKLVDEAERDHEGYWARLAREFVTWKQPFTKVLDSRPANDSKKKLGLAKIFQCFSIMKLENADIILLPTARR